MDFTGKKVVHKTWGEGTVSFHKHPYLKVQFGNETKNLLFPDAFREAMVFASGEDQMQVRQMIAEHEWENLKKVASWTSKVPDKPVATNRKAAVSAPKAPKKIDRPNIVFKCNFCDGGSSKYHIGYMGACSDKQIRYNVQVAHHSWCSDPTCPCTQYLNGEIDGYQLDEMCRNGGFVCYESQMLREWTAFAGYVLKGDRKEEPKKIRNVQINSLAVLTTRKPEMPEEDRFIFGVFLVDDADEGNNLSEGFVKSNSQYRIELTPAEAVQLKFWNYHANDNSPEKAAWSQGLYRYTTDAEAVQILRDIVGIKRVPAERKFAEEFLVHFCKMKGINPAEVPEPRGALKR